jgi:hypothetical protein
VLMARLKKLKLQNRPKKEVLPNCLSFWNGLSWYRLVSRLASPQPTTSQRTYIPIVWSVTIPFQQMKQSR